jgi:hypothetical protein
MRHLLVTLSAFSVAACNSPATDPGDSGQTTNDAGHADAGPADAGGADAGQPDGGFVTGAPITATAGQWTWVPFSNAFCANGSTAGIGINPAMSANARVLIYLEGGGACWSDLTCYTLMTASYFTSGYSQSDFTAESTDTSYLAEAGGFFDRTSTSNPFQNYSYVYVPYCTGDVHAGNNIVQYGTNTAKHVGYANMTAFLERIVPTFPSAERVYIAGSSAGGYGAIYNWWQTQQAFGSIRVDMIDDSGTLLPAAIEDEGTGGGSLETTWFTQWNLASTEPPGCSGCSTQFDALYGFYETKFPNQHGALLSYTQDSVLPSFYEITTAEFTMGLDQEIAAHFTSNLQYFVVGSSGHVLLFQPTLSTHVGANMVTLQQWITNMVTDSPSWANAGP